MYSHQREWHEHWSTGFPPGIVQNECISTLMSKCFIYWILGQGTEKLAEMGWKDQEGQSVLSPKPVKVLSELHRADLNINVELTTEYEQSIIQVEKIVHACLVCCLKPLKLTCIYHTWTQLRAKQNKPSKLWSECAWLCDALVPDSINSCCMELRALQLTGKICFM